MTSLSPLCNGLLTVIGDIIGVSFDAALFRARHEGEVRGYAGTPSATHNVGIWCSHADFLSHPMADPVTSPSILTMSPSMARMSDSISSSGRGGV